MRRAPRVDINGRCRCEAPGGAGVIEMNVAEKKVTNVPGVEPRFPEVGYHIVEGGFRPGIEQRNPVVGFQGGGGDDAGMAELTGVEDMNHNRSDRKVVRRRKAITVVSAPQKFVAGKVQSKPRVKLCREPRNIRVPV